MTVEKLCGLMILALLFTISKLPTLLFSLVKVNKKVLPASVFSPASAQGDESMNIGEKLRRLRLLRGLTQEEMADRCELSKGFISQVERDLASPSIATLTDMLACLGSSLPSFFSDKEAEKTVFSPQDMFVKEDSDMLRGSITWLVPDAQKNSMEPILVEMAQDGQTQMLPPHDGEEFGYVLSGSIYICMGDKHRRAKAGDSFCLHPTAPHQMKNAGKSTAKFLWISTPPNF